ncbi:MAG: formylglycine-generating enzyme family protein [Pseudomonadota bacterium]
MSNEDTNKNFPNSIPDTSGWSFSKAIVVIMGLMMLRTLVASEPPIITNSLGMEFVQLPAGEFMMGTSDLEEALFDMPEPDQSKIADETPVHPVKIIQAFYLGRTEVTQAQWLKVMGTKPGPDSHWQRSDWQDLPVVSISWYRAQDFIEVLNASESRFSYRLPTEAEWEYAARADSEGLRPFSLDQLDEYAWYIENSGDLPHPVASRKTNAWGVYDMFGNVWEWVADWYSPDIYERGTAVSPTGPRKGRSKVRRGGSYHCSRHLVRSAYRAADDPRKAYSVLGFRLVAALR